MQVIAIVNEKGGTGKTTTSVNLAAALGRLGKKILLVDMDGQGASSRWLGVEEDNRLADAILAGKGLEPIPEVLPGVWLAPGSGKLDSIAHDLRPTQGGQLRKVIAELDGQFDMVLIDCPPSLGNRLIGNALLAANGAIVPVETSILALDGLRILLMMLDDIRDGFEHPIRLLGVLPCRYDARTRLSRLVMAELRQSLGSNVFQTVIRETVRLQECPALGQSIFEYAPKSNGATDYLALATELINGNVRFNAQENAEGNLNKVDGLTQLERLTVQDFRQRASAHFRANLNKSAKSKSRGPKPVEAAEQSEPKQQEPEELEVQIENEVTTSAPVVQNEIIESPATKWDNSSEWREDDSSGDTPKIEDILDVNVPVEKPSDELDDAQVESKAEPEIQQAQEDAPAIDIPVEEPADQWDDTQAVEVESEAEQDIEQPTEQDGEKAFDEQTPARARSLKPLLAGVPVILFIALAASGWFFFVRGESSPQTAEASDWQRHAPIAIASADPITSAVEASPQVDEILAEIDEPTDADESAEATNAQPDTDTATDEAVATAKALDDEMGSTSAPAEIALAGVDPAEDEQPVQAKANDDGIGQPEQLAYRTSPDWLHLKGIMIGPRGGCALINNRAIPVGGVIGNATVIAVHPRAVEMEMDGERFLLHLGSAPARGRGSAATETEESTPEQQDDSVDQPQETQQDA